MLDAPRTQSLQEILPAYRRVRRDEGKWRIYCALFPPWYRLWRNARLFLGADPFDAEHRFVLRVALATSAAEIEQAVRGHDFGFLRRRLKVRVSVLKLRRLVSRTFAAERDSDPQAPAKA